MFDKFAVSCISTYSKAKAKIMKLGKGEDGMETLETVILIAIAVIVAGFIVNFLTKGKLPGSDSDQGLIGYMFSKIAAAISGIFNTPTEYAGGAAGEAAEGAAAGGGMIF